MRLSKVAAGQSADMKAKLDEARQERGLVPDVVLTLAYRPDLFGGSFQAISQEVLRGPSEWSVGQRELFAGFVSACNRCRF